MSSPTTFHPSDQQNQRRRRALLTTVGGLLAVSGLTLALFAFGTGGEDEPGLKNDQTTMLAAPGPASDLQPLPLPPEATTDAPPDFAPTRTKRSEEAPKPEPDRNTSSEGAESPAPARSTEPDEPKPRATRTTTKKNPAGGPKPIRTKPVTAARRDKPVVSAPMLVKNVNSGFCADLPTREAVGSTTAIGQSVCIDGSADNQEFVKVQVGSQFLLRNVKTGLCQDVAGGGTVNAGIGVSIYTCIPGKNDNQMFRSEASGDGVKLVNVKTQLCLDIRTSDGASVDRGQRVVLAMCTSSASQIWQFV